jgi:quinol monooxygenase YgiN
MRCTLREVRDEDLAVLFEQWADPVAAHMAAFTAPDHMDRTHSSAAGPGYGPTRR